MARLRWSVPIATAAGVVLVAAACVPGSIGSRSAATGAARTAAADNGVEADPTRRMGEVPFATLVRTRPATARPVVPYVTETGAAATEAPLQSHKVKPNPAETAEKPTPMMPDPDTMPVPTPAP